MFPALFNQTATINGMQATGTNGRRTIAQLYTNVRCYLEPLRTTTANSALVTELKFDIGQAYTIDFSYSQDVKQGYEVVIGGNTYVVKLVQPFGSSTFGYTHTMAELLVP